MHFFYTESDLKVGFLQRRLCSQFFSFACALCTHNGRSLQEKNWRSLLAKFPTFESLSVYLLISFIAFTSVVCGETIHTFYGPIEIDEPVLIELIYSPALQRLKHIHQYGVSYYTTHSEEYNRFDHSIGVFAILRMKGASLEEQIAGLLHDVSHTAFSHVGDWVFAKEHQENDYQNTIHRLYLSTCGVEKILNAHGYSVEHILPKHESFIMLEQPLPHLNADRVDYNIQGAYFQNFLTKEESLELFQDLSFEEGKWITTKVDLATKLMEFSLYMTENCWRSAINYVTSKWLAEAILQGLKIGLLSWHEFHFGIDQCIWNKLSSSKDQLIRNRMHRVFFPSEYFEYTTPNQANIFIKFKCRAIDPWIKHKENIQRLSSIDKHLDACLQELKKKADEGWTLKMQ